MTDTNQELPRIAYICDGYDKCSMEPGCFLREDPYGQGDMVCRRTTDPNHSATPLCEDPENHPERFIFCPEGERIKYYERYGDEDDEP